MLYYREVLIPFSTLESAAITRRLIITSGVATEQWFMFPDGPYGLAHMQVWHHGWMVWPWDQGESYHWNNFVYHIQDRYPFVAEPFEVVLRCWNLDDTFDHSLTFAMVVDPLPPLGETENLVAILQDLGLE